jgi:hypothetical protein
MNLSASVNRAVRDIAALAAVGLLLLWLLLTVRWMPAPDTRPICAGGPGDAQPKLHAECFDGPPPTR